MVDPCFLYAWDLLASFGGLFSALDTYEDALRKQDISWKMERRNVEEHLGVLRTVLQQTEKAIRCGVPESALTEAFDRLKRVKVDVLFTRDDFGDIGGFVIEAERAIRQLFERELTR